MRPHETKKVLRCAVYTQVSTEYSLEQEFIHLLPSGSPPKLQRWAVRMTISLACDCPLLARAEIEGTLPRRLRMAVLTNMPMDWESQRGITSSCLPRCDDRAVRAIVSAESNTILNLAFKKNHAFIAGKQDYRVYFRQRRHGAAALKCRAPI
jgi:hypothetical protein